MSERTADDDAIHEIAHEPRPYGFAPEDLALTRCEIAGGTIDVLLIGDQARACGLDADSQTFAHPRALADIYPQLERAPASSTAALGGERRIGVIEIWFAQGNHDRYAEAGTGSDRETAFAYCDRWRGAVFAVA